MSFIQQVTEAEATGRMKAVYDAAVQRTGYVANIIKVMSQDPRSCDASMRFYVSMMKTPNGLSPQQREMLATVVSNINDCYY